MAIPVPLDNEALLIFEDVPAGTEVGIDYKSWHVGPKFRGIKGIPPGFHYIFFSAVDNLDQHAPRTGFFVFVQSGDIIIRRYDKRNEDLVDVFDTEHDVSRYRQCLTDVYDCLGPYPFDILDKWRSVSNYISEETLQRVQPKCGKINVLTEVPSHVSGQLKRSARDFDSRLVVKLDLNCVINFTEIPSRPPSGSTPAQISKCNMDSTFFLQEFTGLFSGSSAGELEVLGELQFAFICFLLGQVYDAFDHWKALVTLFTSCQDGLETKTDLLLKFLDILSVQLMEIPEDFFVDIVAQSNFLVQAFQRFFQSFEEATGISSQLVRKVSVFKREISSHFDWTFDNASDDDAPVVVDLVAPNEAESDSL